MESGPFSTSGLGEVNKTTFFLIFSQDAAFNALVFHKIKGKNTIQKL